ncbi:TrkH family potassium uptake protein [Kallotenue papyrolyticum]|uniref:TrkH family potassium uptake protein n=1 Tax=Kallotenue papyrolyticum TaxID=1325125 RepID=UPI00047210C0|nr:potassium transporter TrkG [Kallotenue papyrolyticum]
MLERPEFDALDDLAEVDAAIRRAYQRRADGYAPPEAPALAAPPSLQAKRNAMLLVRGFLGLIIIGMLLLRLPLAGTERPLTWSEALFTSTSAVTVTGLGVVTPALELSLFGQIVVLLLMEIGGVGFITAALVLFVLIGRRIGVAERMLLQQTLGVFQAARIGRLSLAILGATLLIQLLGAALLWLRWFPALGAGRAAYLALFHAVSAFCNAGFDLYSGADQPLFGFGTDPWTLLVLMALIIIGGLGVIVVSDLVTFPFDRRLTVHTRLTVLISLLLWALGTALLAMDHWFGGAALAVLAPWERWWVALFSSISARTAGLTIIPLDQLSQANGLVLMLLMFIGGAPASMAGGITISTIAVIVTSVLSTVRGLPQAVVFGRVFPLETIAKAAAIITVSTLLCFITTLALLILRPGPLLPVAFEVVSAFSNTGYSVGLTTQLSDVGRLIIAFVMFWGRLGPLTLVILLAQREQPSLVRYPAERVVMG